MVFPKRLGTGPKFARLVRSLIENDYMNAEVVRFDGGIRFQPKYDRQRPAVSDLAVYAFSAASAPGSRGHGRPVPRGGRRGFA